MSTPLVISGAGGALASFREIAPNHFLVFGGGFLSDIIDQVPNNSILEFALASISTDNIFIQLCSSDRKEYTFTKSIELRYMVIVSTAPIVVLSRLILNNSFISLLVQEPTSALVDVRAQLICLGAGFADGLNTKNNVLTISEGGKLEVENQLEVYREPSSNLSNLTYSDNLFRCNGSLSGRGIIALTASTYTSHAFELNVSDNNIINFDGIVRVTGFAKISGTYSVATTVYINTMIVNVQDQIVPAIALETGTGATSAKTEPKLKNVLFSLSLLVAELSGTVQPNTRNAVEAFQAIAPGQTTPVFTGPITDIQTAGTIYLSALNSALIIKDNIQTGYPSVSTASPPDRFNALTNITAPTVNTSTSRTI